MNSGVKKGGAFKDGSVPATNRVVAKKIIEANLFTLE